MRRATEREWQLFKVVAYQERSNRSGPQGGVAAEIGIGEEGPEEGGEAGGAVEHGDEGGGRDALHVENGGEVDQEVGGGADRPQLLKRLVSCPEFSFS